MNTTKENIKDFDPKKLDIEKLKEEKGKYVIASLKNGKLTKVKLLTFDESKKNPMFTLFSITWNPPKESGIYICTIEDFRKDKKDSPYLVITPITKLDNIHYYGNCWNVLFASEMFWHPYTKEERPLGKTTYGRYNTDLLYARLNIEESNEKDSAKLVLDKVIKNETNLDDICSALNTADDFEKEAHKMLKKYKKDDIINIPNVSRRIQNEKMDVEKARNFLIAEHNAYVKLGFSGAVGYIEEAEQVLQHYQDKKVSDKEARKKKRKEKKDK